MHRPTLGVIALVLLIAGGAGQIWASSDAGVQQVLIAFWRVGFVLATLWLALPQTRRLPNKLLLVAIVVIAVVLATRPKIVPILLGFLLLFALLRPRIRARPPGPIHRPARKIDPTENP
ncbi:MAG TPA: hypothetical protein VMV69_03405 [Pirellulales bacterium]|nr:hypothetical protein [Pirellulales bacterium]